MAVRLSGMTYSWWFAVCLDGRRKAANEMRKHETFIDNIWICAGAWYSRFS